MQTAGNTHLIISRSNR